MLETLKTLCSLPGASGREDAVREYLIRRVNPHAEYEVDALGNLLVHKKGAQRAKKKVMLAAHMDEVALIVTYITEDGYLKFSPVGGIDPRVLFGRGVFVGEKQLPGVIGSMPVHLLEKDDLKKSQILKNCILISARPTPRRRRRLSSRVISPISIQSLCRSASGGSKPRRSTTARVVRFCWR